MLRGCLCCPEYLIPCFLRCLQFKDLFIWWGKTNNIFSSACCLNTCFTVTLHLCELDWSASLSMKPMGLSLSLALSFSPPLSVRKQPGAMGAEEVKCDFHSLCFCLWQWWVGVWGSSTHK